MSNHENKLVRHQEYFFRDGDITIRVEDSLFRFHKYFLTRESKHFHGMLIPNAIPCRDPPGSSETNPIVLKDATTEGFASLLWVFYNPEYSIYKAPLEKWKHILKLAQQWGFAQVEKLCIRELENLSIPPVEKIELYQEFKINQSLLHSSYVALTTRPEPLDVKEGNKLGLDTSLTIARARELARARDHGFLGATEVRSIIEDVFGLGSGPPPSTTPPQTQNQNSTTNDHADKGGKNRNKNNKS
ncbi:hypothetical protein EDB92DRAFT_1528312 [Lactarius akahatsu]|uniref:BTB domain-containing protein n=1 Tax=Lactarius akahatsu TaxID=416441 RepID=A0AAD4QG92_9AGAM|nr:hypothetical protein EDB92DRAFT_1528312 [Lactarius akahatsu]